MGWVALAPCTRVFLLPPGFAKAAQFLPQYSNPWNFGFLWQYYSSQKGEYVKGGWESGSGCLHHREQLLGRHTSWSSRNDWRIWVSDGSTGKLQSDVLTRRKGYEEKDWRTSQG